MFDDKKGSPPINLPIIDPVTPSGDTAVPNTAPPMPASPKPVTPPSQPVVEDIFSDIPAPSAPMPQNEMHMQDPLLAMHGKPGFNLGRLIIVIIGAVVVFGLVIYAGATLLRGGRTASPAPVTQTPQNNVVEQIETPVQDTDRDQLTNDEEIKLGTSINNADTDNDGLSDFDEVRRYMTDPLNADTDGDGFKDGDEVRAGYSPTGPGKLFEIPQ